MPKQKTHSGLKKRINLIRKMKVEDIESVIII